MRVPQSKLEEKQNVVSRSSVELELRALAHGLCEGLWTRTGPIELLIDNKSAIFMAKDPIHHDWTKACDDWHILSRKRLEHRN